MELQQLLIEMISRATSTGVGVKVYDSTKNLYYTIRDVDYSNALGIIEIEIDIED